MVSGYMIFQEHTPHAHEQDNMGETVDVLVVCMS